MKNKIKIIKKYEELKIFTCDICKKKVSRNECYSSCICCGKGICINCINKLKKVK